MKNYVYVAGPMYGSGHLDDNIVSALQLAEELQKRGFVPFVPHLYFLWHFRYGHSVDYWLDLDKAWLLKCDAVLCREGLSPGARKEEEWAAEAGIPVFHVGNNLEGYQKALRKMGEHLGLPPWPRQPGDGG